MIPSVSHNKVCIRVEQDMWKCPFFFENREAALKSDAAESSHKKSTHFYALHARNACAMLSSSLAPLRSMSIKYSITPILCLPKPISHNNLPTRPTDDVTIGHLTPIHTLRL